MPAPYALNLEFTRAEQADDPFAFRFSTQRYLLRSDGGGVKTIQLDWTEELVADLAAVRRPGRDPVVSQRLGETLRRFLQASAWPAQEAQILAALEAERPISLTIRSAAAELYALPWELLTLQSTGQHLGELPSLLVRYEWPETQSAAADLSTRKEHGRILFAYSAAGGAVPAAEHVAAIAQAARLAFYPFDARRDVLENVSCGKLIATLGAAKKEDAPISVLHILCHGAAIGQTFGLALDSDSAAGEVVIVDAERLRQLLAPYSSMVRLVVFCACDSGNIGTIANQLGSLAQTLHRARFAQVIASRYPLSVAGSIDFATHFYSELLGASSSVEQALLVARSQLAIDPAHVDWAAVQMYARAADGMDSRPLVMRPYRGLLAFAPEHQRFFFGRDREIAEIVTDFKALHEKGEPRLLAIDGASGTGKSSVLFAGALPQLIAALGEGARFYRMRPGSTPEITLTDLLATHDATSPALLVIDQFEELFTHVADFEQRQSFVRKLWQLTTDASSRISVILTLRSDFVGRCGELSVDASGLRLDRVIYDDSHRVSIAQMSAQQLRAVIEKPAATVGLQLEHGLAERMLADVDREPGALPLLADTLDLLWQRRAGNTLTQAAYDEIGGVAGALHGRAEKLIAELSDAERQQARRLLVRLGSGLTEVGQGVRLRVVVSSRRPENPTQAAQFESALSRLVEARLLVLDREQGEQTVEVAHEALLRKWPHLAAWVHEDRQMLLQVETVEAWTQQALRTQTLLGAAQLLYTENVARDYPETLSADARKVLADSSEARRIAEERDRFARDSLRMLAAAAVAPDAALQAAILREAECADPTRVPGFLEITFSILHGQVLSLAKFSGHTSHITTVDLSPDGSHIVTASLDHTARIYALQGNSTPIVLSGHYDVVNGAVFSPDGHHILTFANDATARLWPRAGGEPSWILDGHAPPVRDAVFSADGNHIVTVDGGRTLRLWNTSSRKCRILASLKVEIGKLVWSPDGKQVAGACEDGMVRIWYVFGTEPVRKLKVHEGNVLDVHFHPSGSHVLTIGEDGIVCLSDVSGHGKPIIVQPGGISQCLLSPDGKWITVGNSTGRVGCLSFQEVVENPHDDLEPGMEWSYNREARLLVDVDAATTGLAFSDDSRRIVSTHKNGVVVLSSIDSTFAPRKLIGHRSVVESAVWTRDGRRLVTASADGTARLWDVALDSLQQPTVLPTTLAGELPPDFLRRSPSAQKVTTEDGQVRVSHSDGSVTPMILEGQPDPVLLALFSPDREKILTVSEDGTTRILFKNGRSEILFRQRPDAILAIRSDWKQLITEIEGARLLWALDLDAATIIKRLWQATDRCLSPAERERFLDEPHALAVENHQASLDRLKHET